MIVHDYPINWYIDKLQRGEYFSMGMYGDGEWLGIFHDRIGGKNAEETLYTQELCDELEASLVFDGGEIPFLFATGKGLEHHSVLGNKIDEYLESKGLNIEFVEKDMWDREVREMRFAPFIKQLRQMNVVIVSNKALRELDFLLYDHFMEVGYPNCHEDVDRAVQECVVYGKPSVFLVCMGLPGALFVQKLHGKVPQSFILELGSVWDIFVGIGAQRGWRQELYANPAAWEAHKQANLTGI